MAKMITTYLLVILAVALGFFGVGALASVAGQRDSMQPPAIAPQQFRVTKTAAGPLLETFAMTAPQPEPLRQTSSAWRNR